MSENSENNKKQEEKMLSTLDNPFNPFKDFKKWNQYDQAMKYNTLSYLGRVVDYTNCETDEERRIAREKAMEQIIALDPLHIYCKVSRDEEVKPIDLNTKIEENLMNT